MQLKYLKSLDELIQKFAAEYYYEIPNNAKQLLADFYVFSFFYGKDVSEEYGEDTTQYAFNETFDRLLTYMKSTILQLLALCISKELKHMNDYVEAEEFLLDFIEVPPKAVSELLGTATRRESDEAFQKRIEGMTFTNKGIYLQEAQDHSVFQNYYLILRSTFGSDIDWITKLALSAFRDIPWARQYGGTAWVQICEAYIALHDATTSSDIMVQIDHVVDLQHNTGTVFTKVEYFYERDQGYGWLNEFLDRKAEITNIYQLYFKLSPSAQQLVPHLMKNVTGETLESYFNGLRQKFVFPNETLNDLEVFVEYGPAWLLDAQCESMVVEEYSETRASLKDGIWHDGEFKNGNMTGVTWKNGIWSSATNFQDGLWEGGMFIDGHFQNSTWKEGTFVSGNFKESEWHDGVWLSGNFLSSMWHNGVWKDGILDGKSEWFAGEWYAGRFRGSVWHDGLWHAGHFFMSTWHNGTWESGYWEKSDWLDGTWSTGDIWTQQGMDNNVPINPHEYKLKQLEEASAVSE